MSYSNAPFVGGASISPGAGGFFGGGSNENAGDFAITVGNSVQRILIGSVAGQAPGVVVDSNQVAVSGALAVGGDLKASGQV